MKKNVSLLDNTQYEEGFKTNFPKSFVGLKNGDIVSVDFGIKEINIASHTDQWYKLFTESNKDQNMNDNNNISLVQKYRDSQLTEPIKTLKAEGVLNNEGNFTRDGWDLFTQWLLKKFGDEFKTDVVDKLVEQPKA